MTKKYVRLSRQLALRALDFHGGQFTDVYRVGSSTLAGHCVNAELVRSAADEVESVRVRGSKTIAKALRSVAARGPRCDTGLGGTRRRR